MEFRKVITVIHILLFTIYHVSTDDKNVQPFIVSISSDGSSCPDNVILAEARYNITQHVRQQLSGKLARSVSAGIIMMTKACIYLPSHRCE